MSRFSVTIGAYGMPNFVELNIRSCRSIFGNAPILIYCGSCPEMHRVKEIADRFDCSFITENFNRSHFLGCLQTSVAAVAFAQANGCDYSLKSNQRMVLLGADVPERLEHIFDNQSIDIAMPSQMRAETIYDAKSKFHAGFTHLPDIIACRAANIDPQSIADDYAEQVRTGTSRNDNLIESFWKRQCEGKYAGRYAPIPWLSEPTNPPIYLRKCQHKESDYNRAAKALGMPDTAFNCAEWTQISGAAYRPHARA